MNTKGMKEDGEKRPGSRNREILAGAKTADEAAAGRAGETSGEPKSYDFGYQAGGWQAVGGGAIGARGALGVGNERDADKTADGLAMRGSRNREILAGAKTADEAAAGRAGETSGEPKSYDFGYQAGGRQAVGGGAIGVRGALGVGNERDADKTADGLAMRGSRNREILAGAKTADEAAAGRAGETSDEPKSYDFGYQAGGWQAVGGSRANGGCQAIAGSRAVGWQGIGRRVAVAGGSIGRPDTPVGDWRDHKP